MEGFRDSVFPSGIAAPALVIVVSWGLCGFLDSVGFFFTLFEADNLQHIPKPPGDFGIILVKTLKAGEMAHNFRVGHP